MQTLNPKHTRSPFPKGTMYHAIDKELKRLGAKLIKGIMIVDEPENAVHYNLHIIWDVKRPYNHYTVLRAAIRTAVDWNDAEFKWITVRHLEDDKHIADFTFHQ